MAFRSFLLILLCLNALPSPGQVTIDPMEQDLGTVRKGDPRHADFRFINPGDEAVHILRLPRDRELSSRITGKRIPPDSSITLRVQYNPSATGAFSKAIPVYLSDRQTPVELTLKGTIDYIEQGLDCPTFRNKTAQTIRQELEFQARIRVIDSLSREPVPWATVEIYRQGRRADKVETNSQGIALSDLTPDLHYVVVNAKAYRKKERSVYFNRHRNEAVFELVPTEPHKPTSDTTLASDDPPPPPEDPHPPADPLEEPATSPDTVQYPKLPLDQYAPNNVVFLVDRSTSMKHKGKLELLKVAMTELLDILRDVDRVALVAYSTEAQVILPSIPANRKKQVDEKIRELSAGGSTAGKKGIRKAYQVAEEHFIEAGNNMVFIATDGAFNDDTRGVMRLVKRYDRKGIGISVVGVKNSSWTEASMKKIASKGQGTYVHIESIDQAKEGLVKEVKRRSREATSH